MDVVDTNLLAIARHAVHHGRSEARKGFFKVFAFYFIVEDASLELLDAEAAPSVREAGADSTFFSDMMQLRATMTGDLDWPEDPDSAAVVHTGTFKACLYNISGMLLQALELQLFLFGVAARDAVACNLRNIVLNGDRSWSKMTMKAEEKMKRLSAWGFLLPLLEIRMSMEQDAQTLTAHDKHVVLYKRSTLMGSGTATVGDGFGAGQHMGAAVPEGGVEAYTWLTI